MRTTDSLTKRSDGRWCKKHQGRTYYFRGSEADALRQWNSTLASLTPDPSCHVTKRRVSEIRPSPENTLYDPVTPESVKDLVPEIKRDGVLTPLVVTLDGFILSGHRRCLAAKLAGLVEVPVLVHPINRADDIDEFVRLLVAYNDQRVKTFAEKLHEHATKIDPTQAYRRLVAQRAERAKLKVKPMVLGKRRKRSKISDAKKPMLDACLAVLARVKKPVSDRKIHYELLNDPPLKNSSDPESTYRNDRNSFNNLTNLLTRARIDGTVPWEWISDETRPVTTWDVWRDTQQFIGRELHSFMTGYYRDLLQSQP